MTRCALHRFVAVLSWRICCPHAHRSQAQSSGRCHSLRGVNSISTWIGKASNKGQKKAHLVPFFETQKGERTSQLTDASMIDIEFSFDILRARLANTVLLHC